MKFPVTEVEPSPLTNDVDEEIWHTRQLRSLLVLFALYATALAAVIAAPDGVDLGCILAGLAGHVLYATAKLIHTWRDAEFLRGARLRVHRRFATA